MANHDTYKKNILIALQKMANNTEKINRNLEKIVELMALSIDLGPKEDTNLKREVK